MAEPQKTMDRRRQENIMYGDYTQNRRKGGTPMSVDRAKRRNAKKNAKKQKKPFTQMEALAEVRIKPAVSVPIAGMALGELNKNSSYDAANTGKLGVDVFDVGGKKRVASIAILRKLGLENSTTE
jgi:hypothetical protein